MNRLEALNQALFLAINATPETPGWLIQLAIFIGSGLILAVPLLLLGMWLWGDEQRRNLALKSGLVLALALGINLLIGLLWQHPRPFMLGLGHSFISHSAETSFPSDHLTVFASVGLTCLLGDWLLPGTMLLIAGLAVAWARIFLGVHFPLDMLGALLVSTAAGACVSPFWAKTGNWTTQLALTLYRTLFARAIRAGLVRH